MKIKNRMTKNNLYKIMNPNKLETVAKIKIMAERFMAKEKNEK